MEHKSLPTIINKSIKIGPGATPAPERLPDDLPGLILEVPGSIFDLKMVIFDTAEAYFSRFVRTIVFENCEYRR